MTIALFSSEFPPFNNHGGIGTFMAQLAKTLTAMGHEVIVFIDGGSSLYCAVPYDNYTIVPFLNSYNSTYIRSFTSWLPHRLILRFLNKYAPELTTLFGYNLLTFLTFIAYRKHADIHTIHTPVLFAPAYLISLLFPSITVITHAQGPDELLQSYNWNSWGCMLKAQIETSYMKHSRYIVACSQTIYTYLKTRHQTARGKLINIPNFVDTKIFPVPKKNVDTNKIIFFGRMEYRKGPDLVVKAFAQLARQHHKLKLICIGEDPYAWKVGNLFCTFSQYVDSLNLAPTILNRISFVPRIDERSTLIKYLTKNRGIAILPSRFEPFGFVFLEAMMTGSITVASKNGGGSEIIQNAVDGFTVNPSVKSIVACIHKIKSLRSREIEAITRRARKTVQNKYDISYATRAYKSLYRNTTILSHPTFHSRSNISV